MSFFSGQKRAAPLAVHIDDDTENQDLVAYALKQIGITTMSFTDVHAGLRYAEKEIPNVFVLDLEMPGASGLDICANIRANPKLQTVPVLMLTGRSEAKYIDTAVMNGANAYMTKPFDVERLQKKVLDLGSKDWT